MPTRRLKLSLPLIALLLAALACGGSTPVTLSEIAVFPGAAEITEGNIVADSIVESIKQTAGQDAVDVDVRTYTLPKGQEWAPVRDFYLQEMGSGDWKLAEDLVQETDFVSTYGWTRGGLSSEQAFAVAFSLDPLGGPPLLIVALFSE